MCALVRPALVRDSHFAAAATCNLITLAEQSTPLESRVNAAGSQLTTRASTLAGWPPVVSGTAMEGPACVIYFHVATHLLLERVGGLGFLSQMAVEVPHAIAAATSGMQTATTAS